MRRLIVQKLFTAENAEDAESLVFLTIELTDFIFRRSRRFSAVKSSWTAFDSEVPSREQTPCGRMHSEQHPAHTLMVQQPALPIKPTAVAGQAAVAADDAVAGQDEGDGVCAVRGAHGAHG
jgi:hypothetical protein